MDFSFFIMKMDFYWVTTSSRNKYVKDRYEWRGGSFVDENEWPKSNRKEHLENPIPNFPSHTPKCKREREWEALSLLERREMYSAGASSYPHVKKYKETNYPPSFYFWSSCFPFHRLFFFFYNYFVFFSFFFSSVSPRVVSISQHTIEDPFPTPTAPW